MKLYTAKIGRTPYFLDITWKSGTHIFAPTKEMVFGHKNGTLSDDRYTELYLERMRISFRNFRKEWLNLFRHDTVVFACYCRYPGFCHRHILADIIKKIAESRGINDLYLGGEIGT